MLNNHYHFVKCFLTKHNVLNSVYVLCRSWIEIRTVIKHVCSSFVRCYTLHPRPHVRTSRKCGNVNQVFAIQCNFEQLLSVGVGARLFIDLLRLKTSPQQNKEASVNNQITFLRQGKQYQDHAAYFDSFSVSFWNSWGQHKNKKSATATLFNGNPAACADSYSATRDRHGGAWSARERSFRTCISSLSTVWKSTGSSTRNIKMVLRIPCESNACQYTTIWHVSAPGTQDIVDAVWELTIILVHRAKREPGLPAWCFPTSSSDRGPKQHRTKSK